MKLDLPVLLLLLLPAAAIQTLLPPLPLPVPLKLPLLPAVALYYALEREWAIALVAALWAGILTDALGGVPGGTSSLLLLFLACGLLPARKVLPEDSAFPAAAAGAATALVLGLAQYVSMLRRWETPPAFFASLASLAALMVLSAAVAVAVFPFARRLDLLAGNVEPRNEVSPT